MFQNHVRFEFKIAAKYHQKYLKDYKLEYPNMQGQGRFYYEN